MRVLFSFAGGPGHFDPMAPIVLAAQGLGHAVAVACGPSRVASVEAAGFRAFSVGPARPGPRQRLPLLEVDVAREERDVRERLAGQAARTRAEGIRSLAFDWRPDVMVADEADFGAVIAAEALGIPCATVLVLAAGSLLSKAVVAATLDAIRAEWDLPPDPGFLASSRYLVLSPFPPILRDPEFPLPATTHLYRSVEAAAGASSAPWPRHVAGAPTVYFTLGTEFNMESGDLFSRVVAGLGELPVNVLVTLGDGIDPWAELGVQPPNVHVERYLPQAAVLPHCDLVVFHGGSGTLVGALAHGLPMVLIPMGADQPANAGRCEALGLGVSLDPVRLTPEQVREHAASVLADPHCREAARRLQAKIAAQPEPGTAVALLERLAAERNPILSGAGVAWGRG